MQEIDTRKRNLEELKKRFLSSKNFDHRFDNEEIITELKNLGEEFNMDPIEVGKIYFAVRDISTLKDSETLDGGDGSLADKIDIDELIETYSSRNN